MADVGTAYVQIIPSAKGFSSKLKNAFNGVQNDAQSAGEGAGLKLGTAIKTAIAAAGIGKAISASIMEGGKLQQSLGGVETLFKGSASTVKKNADAAFKTAGLSANDYMENVTSFSASLISSLGGDTTKAASMANMAMTDMSDNANKMGTDMGSITQTYQSLARGNYAMLDNLKLGFGGTKTEMSRLMAEASKISGQKYKLGNFADTVQAIHVMQNQLKITGTTSKEAATTLEGSFNSMKSAAQNLLGNLALGRNLNTSLKNLLTTTKTFVFGNLLPMIGTLGNSVSSLITSELPKLGPKIVNALKSSLSGGGISNLLNGFVSQFGNVINTVLTQLVTYGPKILTMGAQLVANLSKGLVQGIPQLLSGALNLLDTLADNLLANAPKLIQAGYQMLSNLVQGFNNSLPMLISRLPEIISKFADVINNNAPTILAMGAKLVMQLAQGIVQSIPVLVANLPKIFEAIVKVFSAIQWLSLGKLIIDGIKAGLSAGLSGLAGVAGKLNEGILNGIKALPGKLKSLGSSAIKGLGSALKGAGSSLAGAGKSLLTFIVNGLKALPSKLMSTGKSAVTSLGSAIKSGAGSLGSAAKSLLTAIVNGIKSLGSKLMSVGKTAVSSLAKAVRSGVSASASAAKAILTGVVNAIRSMPSKLMSLARSAVSKMASAINPGTVVAKMKALGSSAVNAIKNLPSQFVSIGKNIVMGVVRGIAGSAGTLYSKIKSTMSGMVPKALHALGIHSPSRVFANKVGKYIPLGVNVGINKTIGTTYTTIERYAKTITKKAVKSTKSTTKAVSKAVKKSAKKAQKDIYKASSGSGFANSVIGSVARTKTKTKTTGKGKKKKTKTTKTKLTAEQYGSKLMSSATSRVSALEAENKISYKQEVKYWEKIRSQLKKGTKAYDQATVKIGKAKNNQSTASSKAQQAYNEKLNKIVEARQNALDMYKKQHYNKVSTDYEAKYWKKVMKEVKKGSEAYKTAYGNYLDAHNETVSNVSELKKTYKDSVKEAYSTLKQSTQEAYNNYTQTTDELWKTYNDTVTSRASEIRNNFKLGEDFTLNLKTGKKTLFSRLQAQLSGATRYANALDNLRSRLGDTSELYKALSAMSPSDVKTLESFVSMTGDELAQYNSMYDQISAISNREATADNQSLLASTQTQLAQAKATLDASIASIQADARSQLATATNTYVNGLKTAGAITKSKATKVGQMMTSGISSGIYNGTGDVTNAVSAMCDKLIKQAKKSLKIHSPSRVFKNQVGSFIPLGTAEGITDNVKAVTDAVTDVNDSAVKASQLQNYAQYRAAYLPYVQKASESTSNADIIAKLDEIKDRPVVTYLDGRMVSKQLVKPLDEELGAYKKWKTT